MQLKSEISNVENLEEICERSKSAPNLLASLRGIEQERLILDRPTPYYSELQFMPAGAVRDLWLIKEYEFQENTVRIVFDREYKSALEKSPSHVVPTTMHIISQHMAAAFFSRRFGFDFRTEERVKIWPISWSQEIRRVITDEKDLVMEQVHRNIRRLGVEENPASVYFGKDKYFVEATATVNGDMPMTAKAMLFVI